MNGSARPLMLGLAAFGVGLLFALGLGISGMTDPNNIVAFLDVTGAWDPRLIFVMGGAVMTGFVLFRLIGRRSAPVFAPRFFLPTRKDIDKKLVGGAALFGIGWGLGGFCPGPALTAAVTGSGHVLAFVGAMLAGMFIHDRLASRNAASPAPASQPASIPPASDDDPVCAG
jgi:uncharacterized protein